MGTIAQAATRKKIKKCWDPIFNSWAYQKLIDIEKSGAIDRLPSLDNTGLEKRLDKYMKPKVDRMKKKIMKAEKVFKR